MSAAHLRSSTSVGSLQSKSSRPITSPSTAAFSATSSVNAPSKATKSLLGAQVLSHKTSAPSFSFGSGPARIQFTGAEMRGSQTLQAAVSGGHHTSPGPIYNPAPSKKWLGDAPNPHFGTQQQRPPTGAAASDISKLTGKSTLPGPGNYPLPSSMGKQSLGRCHSFSSFSFGTAKQRESAALVTPSPGPVYDLKGTKNGSMDRAAYSFGNEIRTKNRDPSLRTPGCVRIPNGAPCVALSPPPTPPPHALIAHLHALPPHLCTRRPGVYNSRSSVGLQVYSTQRSSRLVGFGTPTVQSSDRGILPLEGRHSPGPVYMNAPACRKQALSTKRSAPRTAFTRADRFRTAGAGLEAPGPGPGEYIV